MLLLLPLLCACGAASDEARPDTPLRVELHPDGARTFHGPDGSTTRLSATPWTVLPTSASATDILVDLLPPERIAGLTELALQYSKLAVGELPASYSGLPRLGPFQTEVVYELGPDLVLTHSWQDPAGLEALGRRGVPSVALPIAGEWEEMLAQLRAVARLVDLEERGAEVVAELEERRERLAREAPSRRRMMSLTPYGEALWTGGAGTTYDLMLRLAGQENASAEAGLEGNVQLRLEELLELDPDVILTGMGSGAAGLEHLRDHQDLLLEAVRARSETESRRLSQGGD